MHMPLPTSCYFPLSFTIRNPIKRKKPEKSFAFLGLQDRPVPEPLVTPPCTRDILANRTAAPVASPTASPAASPAASSAARPAQSSTAATSRENRVRKEGNIDPRSRIDGGSRGAIRGQSSGLGLSRRRGVRRHRTEARSMRSTTAVGSRIAGSRSRPKSKFRERMHVPRDGDGAEAEEVHPYLQSQEYGVVDRSHREGCADRGDGEGRGGRQNRRDGVVESYLRDWRVWWEEFCVGLKGS